MAKLFTFIYNLLSLPVNGIFFVLNVFPSSCYVADQIRRKDIRGSSWVSQCQQLRYGDYLKAKYKSLVNYNWKNHADDKPFNFIYLQDFEKHIRN